MWLEIRTECWVSCWINGNICRKIRYTYWFSLVSELISCSLVSSGLFSWLIPLPSSILNPSDADCSASRWSCPCVSPSSVLAGLANLHHGPSKSKVSSSVMTFSGATCPHGYLRHEPSFSFPPGLSRAWWNAQPCGLLCRQIWVPTRLTWCYSPFPHPWDSVGGKWYKERGKMPEKYHSSQLFSSSAFPLPSFSLMVLGLLQVVGWFCGGMRRTSMCWPSAPALFPIIVAKIGKKKYILRPLWGGRLWGVEAQRVMVTPEGASPGPGPVMATMAFWKAEPPGRAYSLRCAPKTCKTPELTPKTT